MVERNDLTENRPIYRILPSEYSEFASSEYLTDTAYLIEYFENIYTQWLNSLKDFLSFDGDFSIFIDDQLNALAPYFGFAEEFDVTDWSIATKIKLYTGVYKEPFIWRFRGSEAVFNYVVDAFGLKGFISRPGAFIAGISMAGDVCGAFAEGNYKIVIPESYTATTEEYTRIVYIAENWLPFWVKIVEYELNDIPFDL